jgi:hypothetical protein
MKLDSNPIDKAICPLCGGPNHCAVAADPNATECWCEDVKFPAELLDRVPESIGQKACICQKCLQNYQEETGKPDPSP